MASESELKILLSLKDQASKKLEAFDKKFSKTTKNGKSSSYFWGCDRCRDRS